MNPTMLQFNCGEFAIFKPVEFDGFKNRAGLNSYGLTPRQWTDTTHASVNIEGMNAEFIHIGAAQGDRLTKLKG